MKNKYLLSLLWVIVSGFGILMAQEIAIIPQPAHLIVKNESFKFGKQLKVCIASYRGPRYEPLTVCRFSIHLKMISKRLRA